MSIGKRVKQLREAARLSQRELGKILGVTQQTIFALENNNVEKSKHILDIANFFQVSPDWLQFGDKSIASLSKNEVRSAANPIMGQQLRTTLVPVADWITAKKGIKTVENLNLNACEFIPVPADFVNKYTFALQIENADPMTNDIPGQPSFNKGEYIIIDPTATPLHEKFIIADIPELPEAIFRQYMVEGGKAYLKPLNKRYDIINMNEKIRICGTVNGKYTIL